MENMSNKLIRFIHASDIHLGSVLHVNNEGTKEINNLFKEAVYNSFQQICEVALCYKVDFIILSGDVYDKELRTVKARSFFYNQCKRLEKEDIHIYVIRGNHDPLGNDKELFYLPDNVFTLDSEKVQALEVVKKEKVVARILGQSYRRKAEGRNITKDYEAIDNSVYNIGLLHTQLEPKNKNYVPCSVEDLKSKKNINYWALGHIHKCEIVNHRNPVIVYSGNAQGRDIGEEGIRGCLLVEVDNDFFETIKFIPTASVVWKKINIDISQDKFNIRNLSDIEELFIEKAEEFLEKNNLKSPDKLECLYPTSQIVQGYTIQWNIEGKGEIDEILREDEENVQEYLKEILNRRFLNEKPFLYTDYVYINTQKKIPNLDYLKENNEVFKEVDKIVQATLSDKEIRKKVVINFGSVFEKKWQQEEMNEEKIQLDENMIEEIINSAKLLVIEKLLEKGE
ncbi:DNA repair exonuclease [Clostridium aestuarii]|uniref:DNA repair exonuclease n=1 Tax=Clostridium aestuarii TaxID=338193 RepID=A0ABT4D070_9CLOT|nr:DNA repair exonuclease [Clostridium aestuarii]MCY6484633.1 DNA repair exonuclease [Clostridium aestuarii]